MAAKDRAGSPRTRNSSTKSEKRLGVAKGESLIGDTVSGRTIRTELRIGHALFLSASICALSTMAPQAVNAQTIPSVCTDDNDNDTAENGETITCVSATPIDGISTTVDDVTIVVGSAAQATAVSNTSGTGITTDGGGNQTIRVYNDSSSIYGSTNGIDATHTGGGALAITTADVTGQTNQGIDVLTGFNTTAVTIDTTAGDVHGGRFGIEALHYGSGVVSITTGDVTGSTYDGIDVIVGNITKTVTSPGVMIDSTAGSVYGGRDGIDVYSYGDGYVSIATADVTGKTRHGITVFSYTSTTNVKIDSSVGTVYGGQDGIVAVHLGSGYLSITTADVTGQADYGIDVLTTSNTTHVAIDTTAGTVYGYDDGIEITHEGSSYLSIVTADVTGYRAYGIDVLTATSTTDVTINTSAGDVYGGRDGIDIWHKGSGDVDITTADVRGQSYYGVEVYAYTTVEDVTINTTAGYVYGGRSGIEVQHEGVGYLSITTADVTGKLTNGITVDAAQSTLGTTINTAAGDVYGGVDGIDVKNYSSGGNLTITTGDVTGKTYYGIDGFASSNTQEVSVDTTAGVVYGYKHGIDVVHQGNGNFSITTAGVTGKNNYGIDAYAGGSTDDVTINTAAGAIYGGSRGIGARHNGSGVLSITTADVTGNGDVGIHARADYSVSGFTINTTGGAVEGGSRGIYARHNGTGNVSITTADVTGRSNAGIFTMIRSTATDMAIDTTAGSVYGGNYGIVAYLDGSGALNVTTADVTGQNTFAIDAFASGNVTGVTIDSSAGTVYSAGKGISARHRAYGDLSITTADVTGKTDFGVIAYTTSLAEDLIIDSSAGAVYGGTYGISAKHYGSGALSVTTADVTGNTYDGVYAYAGPSTTTMKIDTSDGAVDGGRHGIYAKHEGSDYLTITTADVTGNSERGIEAHTGNSSTDLSINSAAGAVFGGDKGIYVSADNNGNVSITTADVEGASNDGIDVRGRSYVTNLTINSTAGTVYGYTDGLDIFHWGSGVLSVSTADVTGASGIGVDVFVDTSAADVMIDTSAGAVYGGAIGLDISNHGLGALSVTTADVTGKGDTGVFAFSGSNSTGVTVNTSAGAVTGAITGIEVLAVNSGPVSITTANVTGATSKGIYARGSATVTNLTVNSTAGAVYGYKTGIYAVHFGSEDLSVTTADVTGATDDGVRAIHSGGAVSFDLTGAVYGGVYGIYAYGPNGVSMTLASGASVDGGEAAIVFGGNSNDTLIIETGSSIDNTAFLMGGDDTLNVNGGTWSKISGGVGTDTVNFGGGATDNSTDISEFLDISSSALFAFEIFNFNAGGYTLTGTHTGLSETNFSAGENTLTGSLTSAYVTIADAATLNARDGSTINGDVTNNGTLNVGSSPGVLTVNGDLFLGDTSYLPIEFTDTAYDQIIVTGDVTLGGTIDLIVLDGASFGTTELTIITADGGFSGAVDVASDGILIHSDVSIDDAGTGLSVTTTIANPSVVLSGFTTNQQEIGNHLITSLTGDIDEPNLVVLINAVGRVDDRDALAAALEDLQPEALDMGLKLMTASQDQFVDLVLSSFDVSPGNGSDSGVATIWTAASAFGVDQQDSVDYIGFDGEGSLFAFGVSGVGAGPVRFGASVAYSEFGAGEDDGFNGAVRGDSADGSALHIGANLHADVTLGLAGHIDTSFAYTIGENDLEAHITDPVSGAIVRQWMEADVSSLDLRTRLTVDGTRNSSWPVTPFIEAGFTRYHQDALTITGPNLVPLDVDELSNMRGLASFGVEYDHWWRDTVRFSMAASGTQYFGETQNEFSSRFVGAPTEGGNFLTFGKEVATQIAVETGVAFHHDSGFVISAAARAEAGDLRMAGGSLRVSREF